MTNYNERLDEILNTLGERHIMVEHRLIHLGMPEQNGKNIETRKAKQAITSLIKELVAEARIDEIKKYCTPSIYQAARQLNLETPKTWETAHELGLTPMMADGRIKELKAQQEQTNDQL